jgi:acyl-CoA synthetase (AMP-forming)/AMP-acid ligase II
MINHWVELLRERARTEPDRVCYIYLDFEQGGQSGQDHRGGEVPREVRYTYADIDLKARAIAAKLQKMKLEGKQVLLVYPPGMDFVPAFFGCLYARVVAVPVYAPHPAQLSRTLKRFQSIIQDAKPSAILTVSSITGMLRPIIALSPRLWGARTIATDQLDVGLAESWQQPEITSETLAFLQYTSGSTSGAKGVMVSHGNLISNAQATQAIRQHPADEVQVTWLPVYHDMGLIGGILQPVFAHYPTVVMSPLAFLQRPARWLEAISHYRGTLSALPNFALDLCARKVTEDEKQRLDLSHWQGAWNGAEPVRAASLDRFSAAFASCGFRPEAHFPVYGLAEATLIVAGNREPRLPVRLRVSREQLTLGEISVATMDNPDVQVLVGCGESAPGQRIAIVDPESRELCPAHRIGEIWVHGPGVAQGYWNQPELTNEVFKARIGNSGEGPFLRTGDLGFVYEGQLYVAGRLKDLIIMDGKNHYPQDIELAAEQAHPAIRPGCTAAFAIELDGSERLVLVAEVDRRYKKDGSLSPEGEAAGLPAHASELRNLIQRAISQNTETEAYEVVLIQGGSIPKTSSGKIQRRTCKEAFRRGKLERIS